MVDLLVVSGGCDDDDVGVWFSGRRGRKGIVVGRIHGKDHLNERVMGFRDSLTKVEIDTDWLTKVHMRDNEAVSEGDKTT